MDKVINLLQQGLDGAVKRQKAIANNIANVNTPDYRRRDINFIEILNNKINSYNKKSISLKTDNPSHIDNKYTQKNKFDIKQLANSRYKNDGNNVDIDTEMALLAKNNIYYSTLIQQLTGKFKILNNVIEKGGK